MFAWLSARADLSRIIFSGFSAPTRVRFDSQRQHRHPEASAAARAAATSDKNKVCLWTLLNEVMIVYQTNKGSLIAWVSYYSNLISFYIFDSCLVDGLGPRIHEYLRFSVCVFNIYTYFCNHELWCFLSNLIKLIISALSQVYTTYMAVCPLRCIYINTD